jgi:hypothetical protein
MKKINIAILIFCITFPSILNAQYKTDQKDKNKKENPRIVEPKEKENKVIRWNLGINIGAYHANNYTANYYNGSDQNINNVRYVMSNYYWYQAIKLALNAADTVVLKEFPKNMNYSVTIMAGFMLRYNFSRKYGVVLDVNYTQLKAENAITVQVDPATYLTTPDIRLIPIRGQEKRIHIDLLAQRNFLLRSKIYFFVQAGLNLNYTQVMKSSVYFADQEYSMINNYATSYVPNGNTQQYTVTQGGFGYGAALHGGIGIPLAGIFGIEPGLFLDYNTIALSGYPGFKPSYGFYVSILFGNILPRPDSDE